MKPISGTTKVVGIIGNPIEHSLSPAMHNAAYKKLGLDYVYIPMKTETEDLPKVLDEIRTSNMAGVNVTIPHKENVLPLLDDITELAELIGAINTIENREGKLIGYNTDGPGFLESLKEESHFDPAGKDCVLLGAGGAARAVSVMLGKAGAKTLLLCDIDIQKAQDLADHINDNFDTKTSLCLPKDKKLGAAISCCHLLVNATPIGMSPKTDACPLEEKIKIPANILVYDLIYTPAETQLLKRAKKAGAKTMNGSEMLVRQGALAFTIFTSENAPIDTMRQALLKAFASY